MMSDRPTSPESAPDPFDPASLRIDQSTAEDGVKKLVTGAHQQARTRKYGFACTPARSTGLTWA